MVREGAARVPACLHRQAGCDAAPSSAVALLRRVAGAHNPIAIERESGLGVFYYAYDALQRLAYEGQFVEAPLRAVVRICVCLRNLWIA